MFYVLFEKLLLKILNLKSLLFVRFECTSMQTTQTDGCIWYGCIQYKKYSI